MTEMSAHAGSRVDRWTIDLDRLLKLRLVVARHGEMDRAGWWNTNGMLGRYGGIALTSARS